MDRGLWVSEDKFVSLSQLETEKQSGLLGELYGPGQMFGFDPVSFMGLLPDPDPVLVKMGEGVEVLRSLTSDDKVLSSMQNRKLGTLKKKDYLFEPGKEEDKEPDQASKDICRKLVRDMDSIKLYPIIAQVLDAPYYGLTPVEIIWEQSGGHLHIAGLKPRPHEWFSYNDNHEPVFSGGLNYAPALPDKLVMARHFPDAKNPYGLRLLSRCLWPVAIKKGGIQFWTMLCERFGMPWVIGRVGGQEKERSAALSMLTSMVQNAVAVLSKDAEVDVHTMSGKGGDLHASLVRYCDTAIARVLQGQSLTNEGSSGGHGYAESKTSKEALGDFQEADEHLVVSFMNDLAGIYTRVNYSSGMTPVFRYREPEDYAALADLDTKLHTSGVRFTKKHFTRKYRMAEDEFELAEPDQDKPGNEFSQDPGSGKDEFTPEQAVLERFSSGLRNSALNGTRAMETALISEIMAAENFDDAMVRILEKYPDLDAGHINDLLEKGLLNAALFGVYAEQQEAEGDDA